MKRPWLYTSTGKLSHIHKHACMEPFGQPSALPYIDDYAGAADVKRSNENWPVEALEESLDGLMGHKGVLSREQNQEGCVQQNRAYRLISKL